MIKTATEIERDVYGIVRDVVKTHIKGNVYRRGMRPKNASSEDCVVVFMSGNEEQVQSGELYIHIYVPCITIGTNTNLAPNLERISELEGALRDVKSALQNNAEYLFDYRNTPSAIEIDEIEQSQLSVIVTYKRFTN